MVTWPWPPFLGSWSPFGQYLPLSVYVPHLKCLALPVPRLKYNVSQNLKEGHVILTVPLWGHFIICFILLTMADLHTKFEVSIFTYSKVMEGPKFKRDPVVLTMIVPSQNNSTHGNVRRYGSARVLSLFGDVLAVVAPNARTDGRTDTNRHTDGRTLLNFCVRKAF